MNNVEKNTPLSFCNETIHPGEALSLALPLPELYSCAPLYMPIKVIHGKLSGPCLLVTAAMHGNELNGTEIINQLLSLPSIKKLRGTLIAIPVVNVYGLINRSRTLPGGLELDRCFPGSKSGSNAARVAHLFATEIFSKADYCIDLQTGFLNYSNFPQVYINFADEQAKHLATIFSAPVISNIDRPKGSLRQLAYEQDKPFLLYEAGEAMRFDSHAIKTGLRGILNVMRELHMLSPRHEKQHKCFFTEKNIWIRASTSGISHTRYNLGDLVHAGDEISVIKDPFGASDSVSIKSPEEAVIVGKNNLPLVHEGEALFQLAIFPKMQQVASHLEDWHEKSAKQPKPNAES